VRVDRLPVLCSSPFPGKGIKPGQTLVVDIDLLLAPHEIGAWTSQPNFRIAVERHQQAPQPSRGYDRVVVQKQDRPACRGYDPLVNRGRKAPILRVFDHGRAGQRFQVVDRSIRRRVVDEDELVRLVGHQADAFDALVRILELVEGHNDD
jgi:hypothetical protein